MTSGIGTLLHAQFHLRNQQTFQRLLASNNHADASQSSGMSVGTSPRSFKSKGSRDDEKLDVNARDSLGRTVLHLASASIDASSVEYVRLLLKHPAINVNLQDSESQWTALHRAMYIGNLGVVLLLLQHSTIDTTLKDLEGYTALDLYNSTVEGTKPETSLVPAASTLSPISTGPSAELFTWGANRNASLGHGDSSDRTFPDLVHPPRPQISSFFNVPVEDRFARVGVRQVRMGRLHTGVISTTSSSSGSSVSTLSLCGFGSGGRLGVTQHTQYALRPLSWAGSSQSQSTPVKASVTPAKAKILSVALGQDHTLALTENGEVYSWGLNRFAQLGYNIDDGSAAAQVFSLDDPSQFISQSTGTTNATVSSNGEQIQLIPRRVYGPLKKEFVLGVAASKGASACWVRDGFDGAGGGGNIYTWGLNGGQLGYDRTTTGSGAQVQILPRKVTKITRPVVQIVLGESAMACLLGGAGGVGSGWKGDVLVVWGDRVGRVSFPAHSFPSPITPYRPPQALKSTRIVKIVCSDDSPPPFSLSALPSSSTTASSPSSHSSSNLSSLLSSQSNATASTSQNQINFACVSEGGEVFVFGVPGVPAVGALGSYAGDDIDGTGGSGSGMTLAKVIKPQRVWALRRGLVGAVRDVAIGVEGSLIVCTDSGHVYVRARSSASDTIAAPKSTSGGKSQRFSRVPYLQRVVGVCASSTGAFGALRVDAEVKQIPWPAVDEDVPSSGTRGGAREAKDAVDALKGWDLIHDMKAIRPWMWTQTIESPLDREWLEDSIETTALGNPNTDSAIHSEKHDDDGDEYDDAGDLDVKKDVRLLRELCAVVAKQTKDSSQWGEKLPYGADIMVHMPSLDAGSKKSRSKITGSSQLLFPAHSVILGARTNTFAAAFLSDTVLQGDRHGQTISILSHFPAGKLTGPRGISFTGFHPLAVLVLMHFLYTDELICIWDRRVCASLPSYSLSSTQPVNMIALGTQIKSELQTLARILVLPEMLKAMESVVKRPVLETLRRDLTSVWHLQNASPSRQSVLAPDVVLQLAEGRELLAYSVVLRARSVYFEDLLSEDVWTKERKGNGRLVKVNLQHMQPGAMEYVMRWLCCGQSEGLFGALEFAQTIDTALEFLFEVLAIANELLLFPLVLLTSQLVLKFLNIHNACYILSEASHYNAYALVSSVQAYIAENLETFLESHMLEALSPSLVKHLSAFIRQRQEEKATIVRRGTLVDQAMAKWKEWLEGEDIPGYIIPSAASLKRQRERKTSHATKLSSPPSPSPLMSISLGNQKELGKGALASPVIRPRASISPSLNPRPPAVDPDDIFDMDEMDIGPPSLNPSEQRPSASAHSSGPSPAWKASSVPRVDMRSVMAEAALTSETKQGPAQAHSRGSPSDTSPFSSVRLRRMGSSQTRLSSVFDMSSTPPTPSPAPRPAGSPWRISTTPTPNPATTGPSTQASSFIEATPKSRDLPAQSSSSIAPAQPQASGFGAGPALGPVFTPSKQSVTKPQPTRRVSSGTPKAWVSAPVHAPLPPTLSITAGRGLSFAAIQQLQLEQGVSSTKDKRSLLEIQQEEQAKREEAEFLKWWEMEEERVRVETQASEHMQTTVGKRDSKKNQKAHHKKSKKPPVTTVGSNDASGSNALSGPSRQQEERNADPGQTRNSSAPSAHTRRGPKGKKGAPPSAS